MQPETKKQKNFYRQLHTSTAHDWEEDKNKAKDIFDDGTMTFFWNAHTITVLVIFSCILVYVAMFEVPTSDSVYNMKRGVIAMVLAFLLFGVTQTPDGPFKRPHPAFWRLIFCISIVYELSLVYLLFQTAQDARLLMKNFDSNLGVELPERSYGGNCLIYDPDNADPWHNIWDKMDCFVAVHFFGWWLKALVIRDYWFCVILSLMFEILEYTLEHQLPNFEECWWDHWILDAILCNSLGIYFGMKTLHYLSMKPYHWRGMWNIPTVTGKMKRLALQFTPYSWTDFNWRPFSSLTRWLAMLGIISLFLLAELNSFYLKLVLWLPPDHYMCLTRIVFFLFIGAAGLREAFQYLDDPTPRKFGRQSWLLISIVLTETLVAAKFDWNTMSKPIPPPVSYFWIFGFTGLVAYTFWKFYIKRDVKNDLVELNGSIPKSKSAEKVKDENANGRDRRKSRSVNNNIDTDTLHQRAKSKLNTTSS